MLPDGSEVPRGAGVTISSATIRRLPHRRYRVVVVLTVVKMVDFSYKPPPAIPKDAVLAAPPSQQCKTAPPGTLTREHRADPRSSHPTGHGPQGSLNWIGSSSPLPQPVLRCKRRSQLPRDRAPVRPHVLHSLPCRYGEGDLNAIADGSNPPARDALGTAEQTSGQHQRSCLVDAEPVTFGKLHPADHGVEGRVDLMHFHAWR